MDKAQKEAIMEAVKEAAKCSKITCPVAREIAERFDVAYTVVGKTCNEMEIKIKGCSLGCF